MINKYINMKYVFLIRHLFFCHRLPERTFNIKGYYFPVCSRCTGIITGIFTCFVVIQLITLNYYLLNFLIAIFLTIPTFLDGFTQSLGVRESNNNLRFVTGVFAGFGLFIMAKSVKLALGIHWGLLT